VNPNNKCMAILESFIKILFLNIIKDTIYIHVKLVHYNVSLYREGQNLTNMDATKKNIKFRKIFDSFNHSHQNPMMGVPSSPLYLVPSSAQE
jgi:hypothetical protein